MKLKDLKKLIESGDDEQDIFLDKDVTKYANHELPTTMAIEAPTTSIKHACNLGDIVASLIVLKKYYEITNRKCVYYQRVGMKAAYYNGATHGTLNENGEMVTLNQPLFNMIKPLLESQEYIQSMEIYQGQPINLDFDVIRGKTFVNMPQGSIQGWLMYAFPDLSCDISQPWIKLENTKHQIEDVTRGKVIINFTDRYRNNLMDYYFLQHYAPDLIFAGTEKEHWNFCNQWQLNIPRLEIKDFLEMAYALRGARFLLSNQSMCWNLATAIGTPRVLEVCQFAQNCLPFYGEDNYGFFHQVGLEYQFRLMYNKTK